MTRVPTCTTTKSGKVALVLLTEVLAGRPGCTPALQLVGAAVLLCGPDFRTLPRAPGGARSRSRTRKVQRCGPIPRPDESGAWMSS